MIKGIIVSLALAAGLSISSRSGKRKGHRSGESNLEGRRTYDRNRLLIIAAAVVLALLLIWSLPATPPTETSATLPTVTVPEQTDAARDTAGATAVAAAATRWLFPIRSAISRGPQTLIPTMPCPLGTRPLLASTPAACQSAMLRPWTLCMRRLRSLPVTASPHRMPLPSMSHGYAQADQLAASHLDRTQWRFAQLCR